MKKFAVESWCWISIFFIFILFPQEKYLTSDEKLLSMTCKDGPLFQALKNYVQLYKDNLSGQTYKEDDDDKFDSDFDFGSDSEDEPVLKGSDWWRNDNCLNLLTKIWLFNNDEGFYEKKPWCFKQSDFRWVYTDKRPGTKKGLMYDCMEVYFVLYRDQYLEPLPRLFGYCTHLIGHVFLSVWAYRNRDSWNLVQTST